jgi:hypothetical protein
MAAEGGVSAELLLLQTGKPYVTSTAIDRLFLTTV